MPFNRHNSSSLFNGDDLADYITRCVFSGRGGENPAILSCGVFVQATGPLLNGYSKSRYRFAIDRVRNEISRLPFMRAIYACKIFVRSGRFRQTNCSSFTGHFQLYDYGLLSNIRVYKRIMPPEYPMHKVTAPVVLYNGLNDWLAHPKVDQDVTRFSFVRQKAKKS